MVFKCKHKCEGEMSTNGAYKLQPNEAKCSVCQVRYETTSPRCYCCNTILSKRRSRQHNRSRKEAVITRY